VRIHDKYNRSLKQRFLDSKFHTWLRNDFKPIPLCWWFEKHNLPVPKYLIGHSVFTLNQVGYRFRNDNGSETSATWAANQNTAFNPTITGDYQFRLRFEINEVGAAAGNASFQVQHNINGAGWATADLTTNGVRLVDSPNVTDGTATTGQLTAGTGTFRAGQFRDTVTPAAVTYSGSDHSEVEFSIMLHYGFLNTGDVITFRLLDSGGLLATYTVTPQMTITKVFNEPPTIAVNTTDATAFGDTTPVLEATATDPTPNDVQYGLHIDTQSNMQGNETLNFEQASSTAGGYILRGDGNTRLGQAFPAGATGRIRRTRFFLYKQGAPTVKIISKIYLATGTMGTSAVGSGNAIAESYTSFDSSTLVASSASAQWVDFYFLDDAVISSGQNYVATVEIAVGSGFSTSGNSIIVTGSSASVTTGNYAAYNAGSWGASSTIDIACGIYTGTPSYTAISTGSGWANTVTPGDTNPFNSGQKVAHTLQTALPTGTYYYRFNARDPSGGNFWGWTPTTVRSFTVNGPRPKIKPYGQYSSNLSTVVPVGGTTGTAGMADPLYLQAGIAHVGSPSNAATPSIEIEPIGTAFDNTPTQTLRSRTYRNNNIQYAKRGGTLVYDRKNKRYVFFGGYNGTTRFNEVWAKYMDVPGNTWQLITPTGTAPVARNLHGATYVEGTSGSLKAGMYVWGGADPNDRQDMFYLDLTTPGSESWTTVTQTNTPTTRSYLNRQMVSTPASSGGSDLTHVYLFGGWPGASRSNDMYRCVFNPASPGSVTWTTLKTNGQAGNPTGRSGGVLDYKPSTHKLYLFGGNTGSAMLSDFWEYDIAGNTWTNTSPTGTAPTGTEFPAGGYDAINNRFWFSGGWATDGSYTTNRNNIGYINDVGGSESYVEVRANAAFSGGDQTFPGHMFSGNIVDTDKGWLVLFQMATPDSGAERYDYIIDFRDTATSNFPVYSIADGEYLNSRDAMGSTLDETANEWIQTGGFEDMYDDATIPNGSHGGDVWTYNATNNQWRYAVQGYKALPQLEGQVVVWDSVRGRAIVFGGLNGVEGQANGVYSLTRDTVGNYAVKQLFPTGTRPAPRWLGVGVFDSARNRAIFALGSNGSSLFNDVWQLDFSSSAEGAWSQLTPTGSVTAVTGPAFGENKSAKRLYIHAGATNASLTTVSTQTAYLDYTNVNPTWTTISTTNGLGRRTPAADFDETNNAFIVYGGFNGTDVIGATSTLMVGSSTVWNHNYPISYPANRRSTIGQFISGKFYVFGGRPSTGSWYKDTWALTPDYVTISNSSWVNKTPDAFSPVYYTVTGGSAGGYHWQTRVTEGSENSLWVSFGGNAESSADYVLGTGTPQFTKTHGTSSFKKTLGTKSHSTDADMRTNAHFTKQSNPTLPTTATPLSTAYTKAEVVNVSSDNSVYTDVTGNQYLLHMYERTNTNSTDQISATWNGKTTLAPSASTVYLQIWNKTSSSWETLASDNTTAANTDFTLTGSITSSLSDYYQTGNKVVFRVYQ